MNKLPYFSLKVVKMKKEKIPLTPDNCSCKVSELCEHCAFLTSYCKGMKKQPKGNWLNGENLDAIEYPCFCTFENNGKEYYGEINTIVDLYGATGFTLTDITRQTKGVSTKYTYKSIGDMIKSFKIKIKPGKVIIFENEEE